MGRLFLFLIILVVAGIAFVIKSAIGEVSSDEKFKNTSLKGETKNVMDKTAKGVRWMEDQWEESKKEAEDQNKKVTHDD